MVLNGDLVGVWRLVTHSCLDEDGSLSEGPLGAEASGLLVYDAQGYVSVAMMRTRQPVAERAHADGPPVTYMGYAGRWRITDDDRVVHQVEIGSHPRVVGTTQVREVRMAGNRLTLREHLGGSRYLVLDWQRTLSQL